MSINELAPILLNLDRADKLRAMQLLIQELAKEKGALLSGNSYVVWSPYASCEAASILLGALNAEQAVQRLGLT